MKTRTLITLGLSALALTGTIGGIAVPGMMAVAASAENPKQAAGAAKKAQKAIAQRKAAKAVQFAEQAVAFAPRDASYRALLGQAYLLAGRFTSANEALADSLSLDPTNGRVALNLALAQIAGGDWNGARNTLDANADKIPDADRGLAYALAGDPVKAVDILSPAVRAADATPKTRQNLALSLALAGRWAEAKSVAAIDVSPDQLDQRIMQWASFSRPQNAYDQVASLLGVKAVADSGQPVQLALNRSGSVQLAAVQPAPVESVDNFMPGQTAEAAPAAETSTVVADAAPVEADPEVVEVAGTSAQVVFGPREEIVQPIPGARRAAPRTPAPAARAPAKGEAQVRYASASPAKGKFYVQLGAYENSAVARDAWRRSTAKLPQLASHKPQGAKISTRAGNFYRLSVGGFARSDADAMCRDVRSQGGTCFVRVGAGDQLASWARPNTQLASR